jgi:hypothetical protein
MATKGHNYTVSPYAQSNLLQTLCLKPKSRATVNRTALVPTYDGIVVRYYNADDAQHREGLAHALIQLHRNYDLTDWTARQDSTTKLYYRLPDRQYLQDALEDPTEWNDLSVVEQQDRLLEVATKRTVRPYTSRGKHKAHRINLCLPHDTRMYYANLLAYHHIPLYPTTKHHNSLTAHVSSALEAIGSGHLMPPEGFQVDVTEPNLRKRRLTAKSVPGRRKYGNHAGTPWMPREWRKLPSMSEPWTQADVDWAANNNLADLAREAVLINPSLSLPEGVSPAPESTSKPTAKGVYEPPRLREPHTDMCYMYKGRNISGAVAEALPLKPVPEALAIEWGIPVWMLRRLVTRERVRRQLNESGEQTPS